MTGDKMVSEDILNFCLDAYLENILDESRMCEVFYKMAECIGDKLHFKLENPEEVYKEAARVCLSKIQRFDRRPSKKAKAVNFFVTIIGCYLRQMKRVQKYANS